MRVFTLLEKLTEVYMNGFYPVDSILITTNSANPGTYLPGTWVAFATGKTLIGVNPEDSDFNAASKTGGSKDAKVVSHTHGIGSSGEHSHKNYRGSFKENGQQTQHYSASGSEQWDGTVWGGAHTHTASAPTGSNVVAATGNKANLPPYITVYMWRRTA